MKTSESIVEISKALIELLPGIENMKADTKGYGYDYISLESILKMMKPKLKKAKLAIIQMPCTDQPGTVGICTRILHDSGEYLENTVYAPPTAVKGTNITQQLGATITYLRRYSLMSILGITDDDTDGLTPAEIKAKNAQSVNNVFNPPIQQPGPVNGTPVAPKGQSGQTSGPIPQGASSSIGPYNNQNIEQIRQIFLHNPILFESLDEKALLYFRPILNGDNPYNDHTIADRDIWNLNSIIEKERNIEH